MVTTDAAALVPEVVGVLDHEIRQRVDRVAPALRAGVAVNWYSTRSSMFHMLDGARSLGITSSIQSWPVNHARSHAIRLSTLEGTWSHDLTRRDAQPTPVSSWLQAADITA